MPPSGGDGIIIMIALHIHRLDAPVVGQTIEKAVRAAYGPRARFFAEADSNYDHHDLRPRRGSVIEPMPRPYTGFSVLDAVFRIDYDGEVDDSVANRAEMRRSSAA